MNWYFSVANTSGGQPSWWLYAGNHRMVAWAGETFPSTYNAHRAAASFKAGAATARYEVYPDAGGSYRWRAWRASDKVAASGESFSSQSAASEAARNVQLNAGGASL
ncbi:DUF1508 domain-containing protein [Propioniciclava coleopterorum]|uniref:DUF1508 domain-containing protein n=1 Tax=Propioniciclava coleopterorum TaxID=2714937 RepID=A0A6G7Y737_9ACTN|nr:DUF1508 domain-containing protein [Propioniciclava coleopterorum]QIK72603.1 DUF1508 domain-containing protein [Propioniciclava coleopterorum]